MAGMFLPIMMVQKVSYWNISNLWQVEITTCEWTKQFISGDGKLIKTSQGRSDSISLGRTPI
jgi:thymidylate synthase